jgi:hypothetical protein
MIIFRFVKWALILIVIAGAIKFFIDKGERDKSLTAAHFQYDPSSTVNGAKVSEVDQQEEALKKKQCADGDKFACMVLADKSAIVNRNASAGASDAPTVQDPAVAASDQAPQ